LLWWLVWQRLGMDTTSDAQHLRDEYHQLEMQAGIMEKELRERQQELEDEKRNSEIVRHVIIVVTIMRSIYELPAHYVKMD